MHLKEVEYRDDGSKLYVYFPTWTLSWEECLSFVHTLLTHDFVIEQTTFPIVHYFREDVTESLRAHDYDIYATLAGKPAVKRISVYGASRLMECDLRLTVGPNLHVVALEAFDGEALKENDHVFDRYMNSLEVITHIDRVERGAAPEKGTQNALARF